MPFRRVHYPSLKRELSNLMAAPSSAADPADHAAHLNEYFRLGGNCLHLHGEGGETHTREMTGRWLRDRKVREDFFICTQIGHDDWNEKTQQAIERFDPASITKDIEYDLKLLGTDRIDLVYLSDKPGRDFKPVIEALCAERKRGRIGAFGLSHWTPERIAQANKHTRSMGEEGAAAVITTELALATPSAPLWPEYIPFDAAMKAVVESEKLTTLAWIGDINQGQCLFDDHVGNFPGRSQWIQRWQTPANHELAAQVKHWAAHHKMNTREVNVAWMLNQNFPVVGIVNLAALVAGDGKSHLRASEINSGDERLSVIRKLGS